MAPLRGHFSVAVGFGETHFTHRELLVDPVSPDSFFAVASVFPHEILL